MKSVCFAKLCREAAPESMRRLYIVHASVTCGAAENPVSHFTTLPGAPLERHQRHRTERCRQRPGEAHLPGGARFGGTQQCGCAGPGEGGGHGGVALQHAHGRSRPPADLSRLIRVLCFVSIFTEHLLCKKYTGGSNHPSSCRRPVPVGSPAPGDKP